MAPLPRYLTFAEHRTAWLAGAFGTVAMVAFFAVTIDATTVTQAWQSIPASILIIATLMTASNAIFEGEWLRIITRDSAPPSQSYRVVAWQLLLQTTLPARLGDLGVIYFIHRWLRQPTGRALFVTLYHRLQDLIAVTGLLLLSLLLARAEMVSLPVVCAAIALCVLLGIGCASLGPALGLCGHILLGLQRRYPRVRWLMFAVRQVLRIRVWYRHRLRRQQVVASFALVVVRWIIILSALGMVIGSLVPQAAAADSFFLATAYIYFGVVPLQGFGGYGTSEIGLAWLLTFYGVSLPQASALVLLLRLLINIVHVGLWSVIVISLRWRERAR